MKNKIIIFVGGILIGIVVSSSVFFIYSLLMINNDSSMGQTQQIANTNPRDKELKEPPELDDDKKINRDNKESLEIPDDNDSKNSEKTNGENNKMNKKIEKSKNKSTESD